MKKFSKIYETKEKILEVIGIDERDIKDICQDLIDEYDFNMKITPQWISKSGSIYYKANQATESYPSISISLNRELSTGLSPSYHYTKNDPRNWSGGIYYEDDANLIKLFYETITRLESMLDQGEIKVFYSIRSMNDIELRITTPIEETKLPIDVENVVNFIKYEIEYLEDLPYDEYKIEKTWSHGNERSVEIVPKEKVFHTDVTRFKDHVPGDVILSRALKMGDRDNTYDLAIIANHIIEKVLSACSKEESKRSDVVAKYYDEEPGIGNNDIVYITWNNQKLIKFTANTETIAKGNIITAKGIFKNESVQMVINKLKLKIEILVEKGYGDPD